jgi:hypothetical protein
MFDKKEYMKQYRAEHRAEHAAEMRRWRAAHPDRVKEQNHEQYLRRKALKEAERYDDGRGDQ